MSEKKDLNANELLIAKKEKQRKKERLLQKVKEMLILLFVIAVFAGGGGYFAAQFMQKRYDYLQYIKNLNQTTLEISQLVDNIRNTYLIEQDISAKDMQQLIKIGAITQKLVRTFNGQKYLRNPFGGKIIIETSDPIWNKEGTLSSPTFKMSYQGLPRRACIDLATMDWGDNIKGLLAVAIGSVDAQTGEDNALHDIDMTPEKEEKEKKAANPAKNNEFALDMLRPRMSYRMNVAKPNDQFIPTPFSKGNAEMGCFCGQNDCSFALHYAVFSTETDKK